MTRALDTVARLAIGAALIVCGARIAASRAPAAAVSTPVPTSSGAIAGSPSIEHVAVRLTEELGAATVELPALPRGLEALKTHGRRMRAPWKDTARHARAELVQLVALRTGATEVAQIVPTTSGLASLDPKKWNGSEGSFAQREAIVAPTPSTLRFRMRVPMDAALEVAPAVLAVGDARPHGPVHDVTFVARAAPLGEPPIEVGRVVVREGERDRWHERRFDLAALAGREIDLELVAGADAEPGATAVALWGTPRIVRRAPATLGTLPYNVLFVVVDSLRPDVLASFHDPAADAVKLGAKHPPGHALLPAIPGLTPNLDALAARSTIYRSAISAASWTRPGTLAMLSGRHSRELGLSPLPWSLDDAQLDAYYGGDPPLLPLAFRRAGAATRAFVNNEFMLGYARVGVDMGFEHVEDHRHRTADTAAVTKSAIEAIRAHAGERWFHFVNYNSPHEPFEPPAECLARVPAASFPKPEPKKHDDEGDGHEAPAVDPVRAYMAEACKDDAAIGELLAELDRLGLRERTLVVVTADHGETLSEAHDAIAVDLDGNRTRFHHAFGLWEETTRIPILLSLPGVVPEGKVVDARVTNLDLPPTILAVEGLEREPRHHGIDLVALARGEPIPERPIVSLGRASAALLWGRYRYVERERQAQKVAIRRGDEDEIVTITHELYDLIDDPGETVDLASKPSHAGTVDELRARLKAALEGVAAADAVVTQARPSPKLLVRFAGGGRTRRVHATITAPGATSVVVTPVGIPAEAVRTTKSDTGATIDVATATAADALVGLDVIVTPASAPLHWSLAYDDQPLGDGSVFGGELGVASPGLAKGLLDAAARATVRAQTLPYIDPRVDDGVFVVRIGATYGAEAPERDASAAAAEIGRALKQWGYAK